VQADLVGIASSPRAPHSKCDGDGERYVRSRSFSVCWMSWNPRLAHVGVRAVGTPF
jgi:hypothetical protein